MKMIEKTLFNEVAETLILIILSFGIIYCLYEISASQKMLQRITEACERSQGCLESTNTELKK